MGHARVTVKNLRVVKVDTDENLLLVFGSVLAALLPPGLVLETHGDSAFLAIAMLETTGLRPPFAPRIVGRDFFLAGYRILARLEDLGSAATSLRGMFVLRSDTNKRLMVAGGNLLTHFRFSHAAVESSRSEGKLDVRIITPGREADLHVVADVAGAPANLPARSPFPSLADAREYAGPLPYTFDYEAETNSIIMVRGQRDDWHQQPVEVQVLENTLLNQPRFVKANPVLAKALDYQKALEDVVLAWQMNGAVLPLLHGAPLRAVVPGWAGDHWIKWLRGIEVATKEDPGFYMQTGYKFPTEPIEPGGKPKAVKTLTEIPVKSLIVKPAAGARLRMGNQRVEGVAFGGKGPITRVQVSVDDGGTWGDAQIDPGEIVDRNDLAAVAVCGAGLGRRGVGLRGGGRCTGFGRLQ